MRVTTITIDVNKAPLKLQHAALTHPLLIRDDVVAPVLLGQMRRQDVEAPAELRKHHVVRVSWRQEGSRNAPNGEVRGAPAASGEPTACQRSSLDFQQNLQKNPKTLQSKHSKGLTDGNVRG